MAKLTDIQSIIMQMSSQQQTEKYPVSGSTALAAVKEPIRYPEERIVHQPKPIKEPPSVTHNVIEDPTYNKTIEAFKKTLVKDKDYGTLPGVNGNVLFKRGALRFLHFMNYRKTEELVDKTINFSGEAIFISYTVKVTIVNTSGEIIAEALGSCNSHESKYIKKGASADSVLVAMAAKRALISCVKLLIS